MKKKLSLAQLGRSFKQKCRSNTGYAGVTLSVEASGKSYLKITLPNKRRTSLYLGQSPVPQNHVDRKLQQALKLREAAYTSVYGDAWVQQTTDNE